jgi:hypothetical protein
MASCGHIPAVAVTSLALFLSLAGVGEAATITVGQPLNTTVHARFTEGSDLEAVESVTFGSVPAASFTVESESTITAVAPPGPAGEAPVTVTTEAGSAAGPRSFVYTKPSPAPTPKPTPEPAPTPPVVLSAPTHLTEPTPPVVLSAPTHLTEPTPPVTATRRSRSGGRRSTQSVEPRRCRSPFPVPGP